jgi:cobalt-precorrin 5A hydrolase
MDLDQAMMVAGVGCKAGASAGEIEAAIAEALARAGLSQHDLEAAGARVVTRSARVQALTGVPSVAEAAALAAAGPASRLIGPRIAVGPATCALAVVGDAT